MASSRYLISSQTLGSAAASVTFSGIPSTYADLVLRISSREDYAADSVVVKLQPNGNNTSTNYSQTSVRGTGSAANSTNDSTSGGRAYIPIGYEPGSTATSSTFSNIECYIPNYALTNKKPMSGVSASESNTTTISYVNYASAGLYHDTTALTSLVLTPGGGGNFVSGSSFYLYGIKSS